MFHSFIKGVLPKDEYKRLCFLYFMGEALILTIVLFFILGILTHFIENFALPVEVVLFLTPFLIVMYLFFRYILSGLEYPEIFQTKDYQKERKRLVKHTLIATLVFLVVRFLFTGVPTSLIDTLDLFMPTILFIIFYYLISILSLKRSIKKTSN